MQYLVKVSLRHTNLWRLVAFDGEADRAFVAQLIALAFDYPDASHAFVIDKHYFSAGTAGVVDHSEELKPFNEFNLKQDDNFIYMTNFAEHLEHDVNVMRAEDKLFCFMPSCLMGSGTIPHDVKLDYQSINDYLNLDECPSLNLKEATSKMRTFGIKRTDAHGALLHAGASPLNFKVK